MLDLSQSVVVVTGATRGIGRHVALALGDVEATVVVVGRTSSSQPHSSLPGSVEATVEAIQSRGSEALGIQADLSDEAATQRIVDETLAAFGRCDGLVNNAAYTSNGPLMAIPWGRWQKAFRVQVVAPLQLCQGFLPGMLQRGLGSVVNVSTGASQSLSPNLALYSTSKLAMERWSDYVDFELAGQGVAVNTLRIDRLVATEGWRHIAETQGIEIATGGGEANEVMDPPEAARHVLWMLQQPPEWSGNTVGFDEISALGGPPTVMRAL
jgi:citronellol/citronellal dehydrogenase